MKPSCEWSYRENVDSEFAECQIGDLAVLAQDCDGDFSRWDVRRHGKYLAAGEAHDEDGKYHFDVAKDVALWTALAIVEADKLNEINES